MGDDLHVKKGTKVHFASCRFQIIVVPLRRDSEVG